jgi:hypothetical protein
MPHGISRRIELGAWSAIAMASFITLSSLIVLLSALSVHSVPNRIFVVLFFAIGVSAGIC